MNTLIKSMQHRVILMTLLLIVCLTGTGVTAGEHASEIQWQTADTGKTYRFEVLEQGRISALLSSPSAPYQLSLLDTKDNLLATAADRSDYMYEYVLVDTLAPGEYVLEIKPVRSNNHGTLNLLLVGSVSQPQPK